MIYSMYSNEPSQKGVFMFEEIIYDAEISLIGWLVVLGLTAF